MRAYRRYVANGYKLDELPEWMLKALADGDVNFADEIATWRARKQRAAEVAAEAAADAAREAHRRDMAACIQRGLDERAAKLQAQKAHDQLEARITETLKNQYHTRDLNS
jgi:hypothetical protein